MKTFIRDYMLLNQPFVFKNTYLCIATLFVIIPLSSQWFGMDAEVLIFAYLSFFMIQDLSNNKFSLLTNMPVRSHAIIATLYANMLIFSLLGVTLSHAFYALIHIPRPLFVSFIIYNLSVLVSTCICIAFASSEFTEDPNEQTGKMALLSVILIIAFLLLTAIHLIAPYGVILSLSSLLGLKSKIIIGIILSLINLISLYYSYKHIEHKVYNS